MWKSFRPLSPGWVNRHVGLSHLHPASVLCITSHSRQLSAGEGGRNAVAGGFLGRRQSGRPAG